MADWEYATAPLPDAAERRRYEVFRAAARIYAAHFNSDTDEALFAGLQGGQKCVKKCVNAAEALLTVVEKQEPK